MGRIVLTGACGFVASTTAVQALTAGQSVLGLDSVNDHYDPAIKRANLRRLSEFEGFDFLEGDLNEMDLRSILSPDDVILHLAASAGVRTSWAENFDSYLSNNVAATQALLEAATQVGVKRTVYASSSSVYGNDHMFPVSESGLPGPYSPYGVTKLAAEHLCSLYARNFGLSTVSLRYFTVYGPWQRPDMAIHRLIQAALLGTPFPLFGDGSQRRDFTFVADVARANLAACQADVAPGTVMNIAGGNDVSMSSLIDTVSNTVGRPIQLDHLSTSKGDVTQTGGVTDTAYRLLDWAPSVSIEEGVAAQVEWHREVASLLAPLHEESLW